MAVVAPRHRHSFLDYLQVEEMSAVKHEFLDGEITAMAGGTPEHAALSAALISLVASQLRGGPCRVFSSDLRLRVAATGLATYPDAAVVCGELERDPSSRTHVTNPTVVFEVLSPGTEDYDRGEKREHYQQIASLTAYVIVAQDVRQIEAWQRGADRTWAHQVAGPGAAIELRAIGCRLAVDEVYGAAGLR
jgi:Uma2 family endonuclease